MTNPTVRAVHRISLDTDRCGQITARALNGVQPLPDGASVVLDAGEGWWINASDLEHIRRALSGVGHISITGVHGARQGGRSNFGIIYGLDTIAERLEQLLAAPPLFDAG
jgi:hypothetical protein